MFWYTVIVTSLILQVLVVFGAERKVRRYLKYALGLLGLATIGFNITSQADAFKGSVSKTGLYDEWFLWVYKAGRILYAVTVGLTSGIFVAKLLYLIRRRKKMGFKGFGPLQVIVIMGAQCLLIPRTFLSIKPSNMFSRLCYCRFLRQHRRIRHNRPNLPYLQSSSLSSLGILRS